MTPPAGKGFGTAVLEQVMAEYFENPPQIEFATNGVGYAVVGSLEPLQTTMPRRSASPPDRCQQQTNWVRGANGQEVPGLGYGGGQRTH